MKFLTVVTTIYFGNSSPNMVRKSVRVNRQKNSKALMATQNNSKSLMATQNNKEKLFEELCEKVQQLPPEILIQIYMFSQGPQFFFLTRKLKKRSSEYYDNRIERFSIRKDYDGSFSYHTKNCHYFGDVGGITWDNKILFLQYYTKEIYKTEIIKYHQLSSKLRSICL